MRVIRDVLFGGNEDEGEQEHSNNEGSIVVRDFQFGANEDAGEHEDTDDVERMW